MKIPIVIGWLSVTLIFSSPVNSDSVEQIWKNVGIEIPNNQTFLDIFSTQVSEYLKLFCDVGLQLVVPDPVCAKQLEFICNRNDILIQMLDATSKYSGMLYGDRFDYGNFDQCLDIDHHFQHGRLMGKFCPMSLLIPDPQTGFTKFENIYKLSICIPDGCSIRMFSNVTDESNEELLNQLEASCVTKESGYDLGMGNIIIMALFIVWFGIVMIFTGYDVYLYAVEKDCDYPNLINLSLVSGFKKLSCVKESSRDHIEIFDGIRAISMIWIIAGHGYSIWIDRLPESNRDFAKYERRLIASHISGAHLAVDSFFYISGFFVALNYLKRDPKSLKLQIKSIPTYYLNRYVRLTVPLLLVYMFGVWIFPQIGKGPVWIPTATRESEICKTYWWSLFFYIQNYYNYDELCIVPTWYLSADMQMFILSPVVLIPLSVLLKQRRKVLLSIVLLVMLNILLTILPILINYTTTSKNTFDTHSRIIDYTLGITVGALMYKAKQLPYLPFIEKKNVKKVSFILWTIVLLQMYLTLLLCTPAEKTTNRHFQVFYSGLSKPVWCIGLCWIIYSCYHGYGGFVNWILTRDIWKILSKMSYVMYLLHYLVIGHFALSLRTRIFFSNYHEFYLFCGYFTETLLLSTFWILVYHYPIIGVMKMLFQKNVVKKDTK